MWSSNVYFGLAGVATCLAALYRWHDQCSPLLFAGAYLATATLYLLLARAHRKK